MDISNAEKFVIITRVVLIVICLASCASQSYTLETGDMDRIVFQDRAALSDSILPDNSVLVASVGSSPNLTEMSLGVRHYSWAYKQDGLWMVTDGQDLGGDLVRRIRWVTWVCRNLPTRLDGRAWGTSSWSKS